MSRIILGLSLASLLLAGEYLSPIKEQSFDLDKNRSIIEAKKLRDSWINPITLSYTYQKGNQFPNQKLENFTISVDQPIFKSGGIWAAIKYAGAKRIEALSGVELSRKALIARVVELAMNYRKLSYQIERQKLRLENARIDVATKRENYLHGTIDSTYLNNAIIQKNQIEIALIELKEQLLRTQEQLRAISDIDPKSVQLPHFTLVPKKLFERQNITLAQKRAAKKAAKYNRYMQIARYLPSLSLFANYNYQSMKGSLYFPGYTYGDHYSTYGLRLTMPLFDINAFRNIEEAKLDYLKSGLDLAQAKRERDQLYVRIAKELKLIDKKIAIAKENHDLYAKLYAQTRDQYRAGEKTDYDLQTMHNSLKSSELDLKIYELDKQLLLLQLYKEMHDAF